MVHERLWSTAVARLEVNSTGSGRHQRDWALLSNDAKVRVHGSALPIWGTVNGGQLDVVVHGSGSC